MKWGIVFSSTVCPDPDQAVMLAQTAEEAGFDSLWAPEHVIIPEVYVPQYEASPTGKMDQLSRSGVPDPLVWFAYVAAVTTRLKFGTGVVILPEHATVAFAKTVATLGHLSKGRFMLGVGVGWCKEEYDALQMPWDNRGKRCEESIEAMRVLWRDSPARYDGRFVRFPDVHCDPKPPDNTVPIHVGGDSHTAAARAGRMGDGFFPAIFPTPRVFDDLPGLIDTMFHAAKDVGRDPDSIEITSGGARTVEQSKWFADLGVHRLTIAVRSKTAPEMREELLRFGD
ncbi:MAG: LLM class F420-dependent oxidoreductase, partial [Acidimicrobiia bacterium]